MKILRLNKNNLQKIVAETARVLQNNGLVVFPSDTVYGLAANALSAAAIYKLFQFKNRPINQSVSIAVKKLKDAQNYAEINSNQITVLRTLLPGPYTVVLKSKRQVAISLEAENGTLGIRIPDYWFTQALSQALSFPYTATSANLHGHGPHYSVQSLINTLSKKKKALLDLVIDFGTLAYHKPSTVINLAGSTVSMLRQGDYGFKLVQEIEIGSAEETTKVAQKLLQKYKPVLTNRALVFILQGDLGTGKTVFTQGLGSGLGINNIVSPTFVIYYEYLSKKIKLHHFDLYRIENNEDLRIFKIENFIKPNNILVFEWGERIGSIFSLFRSDSVKLILVKFSDVAETKRQLTVYEL